MQYWGYHTMLDCESGDRTKITNEQNIREFLKELVPAIGMKAYGEPMLEHFATHDEEKAGYSFCQMIETSNISGHFVDKNGDFYIDVFSCKDYDANTVVKIIDKYFKPRKIKTNIMKRSAR